MNSLSRAIMISQPRVLFLLLATTALRGKVAAGISPSSPRRMRGSPLAADAAPMSSDDIPDIADTRRARSLQENVTAANATDVEENELTTAVEGAATADEAATAEDENDVTTTVEIPTDCLDILLASANDYGKLKKENYFVFTDGMSNGYYTFHNITSYDDLPLENQFSYVTLTCQCHAFGGKTNCCQGDRAIIDVSGMADPESMTEEMQLYVNDICSVTSETIGENRIPSTSKPTTARPTSVAPTRAPVTSPPTLNPTVSILPTMLPTSSPTTSPTDVVTIKIPGDCLNLLAASANEYAKLEKENYFVFTDGMSNGYYSLHNMTSYEDLPVENKFTYIALTCQCHAFGGRGNCCQGDRAKIDVSGIDEPESMSTQMQLFMNDVCEVTSETIGENMLPATGRPTTARPTVSLAPTLAPVTSPPTLSPSTSAPPTKVPTSSPTTNPSLSPTTEPTASPTRSPSAAPTPSPTASPSKEPTAEPTASAKPTASSDIVPPLVTPPGGSGGDEDGNSARGLSPGAWAGIAIAGAAVAIFAFYHCLAFFSDRRDKEAVQEGTKGDTVTDLVVHKGKELAVRSKKRPRSATPDTINSAMTAASSIVSGAHRSGPYSANNNLLAIEEGVSARSPGAMTRMSNDPTLVTSNLTRGTMVASGISRGPESDSNSAIERKLEIQQ